ncbi:hypothetical protein AgCh_031926 [Apium graveolens]
MGDTEMRRFFTEIGYDKDLKNLGQLKRNGFRKEWNYFFECITKALNNKSSDFDSLPIMTQHIGVIPMAIPLILLALGSLFVGYLAKALKRRTGTGRINVFQFLALHQPSNGPWTKRPLPERTMSRGPPPPHKIRDFGSVLSEGNRIGTIRSVEGSITPIGGLPLLYYLGKGQERSFPLTSTYLGRKPVKTKYPTAAFLNGYPPLSELLDSLKGKGETVQGIFHAFTGPVSKERIVVLSCLNESTFVDGCSFGSLLSIF